MKTFLAILLLVALWWWFYPAPTRTLPEQFTPEEKAYYAERHRFHGIGGNVVDLRTGERTTKSTFTHYSLTL